MARLSISETGPKFQLTDISESNLSETGDRALSPAHTNHQEDSIVEQPEYPRQDQKFYLGFLSLCICTFQSSLDTVIVASALPEISEKLHATSHAAYWCGTGFMFSQTISQPVYGALSPFLGLKSSIMFALVVFLVASILCATAQNITWLIAARVLQGWGAGGNNALTQMIMSASTPLQDRGKFSGMLAMSGAVGLVLGVVLGAAISERATWRLIFYINIPICLVAIAGLHFFLKLSYPKPNWAMVMKEVDWIGLGVLSSSLVGVLYGITGGNVLYPWSSPRILASLIIGFVSLFGFAWYEYQFAAKPLVPLRIFSTRTAASGYFMTWVHALILWTIAYYLILYFLIGKNQSLLHAATSTLPGMALTPPFAAVGGILISMTNRFLPFNLISLVCIAVGMGLFSTMTPESSVAKTSCFQALVAVGAGIIFSGRLLAVQAPQKHKEDEPMVTAMLSFMTSLGEAFGVSIGGTVFQNRWQKLILKNISSGQIIPKYLIPSNQAENAAQYLPSFPEEVQKIYMEIGSESLRWVWITMAIFASVTFFTTLLQRNIDLSKPDPQLKEDDNSE